MITIINTKRHTASNESHADYYLKGLSEDTKPTENIAVNSMFLELDTGNFYFFTGEEWRKAGN